MKNMCTLQKRIAYQLQQGSLDAEVTGITCDSRKVQPQNVFVCIRGNRMDGHVYAEEAVERGAAVLVAERELGRDSGKGNRTRSKGQQRSTRTAFLCLGGRSGAAPCDNRSDRHEAERRRLHI